MSHAPGLAGTPDTGHCSRAATRASWASSSARPTSRTTCARPAINSLVSAKGPSITVAFPPEKRTRAPFELACRPSAASITPALTNSSLYFPISSSSAWVGMMPASDSLFAFITIMTRIPSSSLLPSPAGDGADDQERLRAGRHRLRQWRIRWLIREILLAGVEPDEGPTLVRDLVADGAAEHRIAGLERIED